MDSAIGMSDTATVTPSESASQAPKATGPPPSQGKSRPRNRAPKAPLDKDAPPGAVQVPPGGQSKSKKQSPVQSATIPLAGWPDIDLSSHRKDIEPTFTVDARPYADMVDSVYLSMQARYSAGAKHIPRSLFRYYCFTMWWYRALFLKKANGQVLRTYEKDFLNILSSMEEFLLPSHIAQYLGNMGNFVQSGEQYFFRLLDYDLGSVDTPVVKKGWFETSHDTNRVTDDTFWLYSQLPCPAVSATGVCNEADAILPNSAGPLGLSAIYPDVEGVVYPTENIIGWSTHQLSAHHSSWRATFAQLGWSHTRMPSDVQTPFLVSTSTLKWMSERLATLKDFKTHSSKQVTLSVQGHPLQAYYLGVETPASQRQQAPVASQAGSNTMNGSRDSDLAVLSRFAIDSKVLAPAFSFGYRIERSLEFRDYSGGHPRFWNTSNFQPWLIVSAKNLYTQLTPGQLAGMNATFSFGSLGFVNVRRFATHELNRSVGLDAALVLSDTR
ncbi:coat protein [Metarhizium brunneum partitivirus 1]|nr:coat protein [Metarhizium brunneum partitivirus 1]